MICPGEFIPLFESNGLIRKLDYYLWREAAAQVQRWKQKFGVSLPVSVNVSRVDIFDPELENLLPQIADTFGLTGSDLLLEITESAYSDNAAHLIQVVENVRAKGFRIEMDDFGSGYSSLNMLASMPIDVLKMDISFTRNMLRDAKSLKMVQLVLDISRFLGVPVIAEGVENEEQLLTLKRMGCRYVQGFYFSQPVPPEDFGQYRTIRGARLAPIYFRHAAQKFLDLRQQVCGLFVQPDEKSCFAIRTPELCGIAFEPFILRKMQTRPHN